MNNKETGKKTVGNVISGMFKGKKKPVDDHEPQPEKKPVDSIEQPEPPDAPETKKPDAPEEEKPAMPSDSVAADITLIRETLASCGYKQISTYQIQGEQLIHNAMCTPESLLDKEGQYAAVSAFKAAGILYEDLQPMQGGLVLRNIRTMPVEDEKESEGK